MGLYINNKTHKMVLAHRGTEMDLKKSIDLKAVISIAFDSGKINAQQKRAENVTKESFALATGNKYEFSVTGHSLGTWLAAQSTFIICKNYDKYVKGVLFDPPGTQKVLDKMASNLGEDKCKVENL